MPLGHTFFAALSEVLGNVAGNGSVLDMSEEFSEYALEKLYKKKN